MSNSFWNNPIVHVIVNAVLLLGPSIIDHGGSWMTLTLGGLLAMGLKVLQNKSQGLTLGGHAK